ncbi:MAG: acyltransferase family protein [Candidatus Geothermincolia bacterium]
MPRVGQPPGRAIGVDAVRGLAILLVVLGHSISNAQNLLVATPYNPGFYISSFLYTFHMPLFFLVSGYVLFGKRIRIGDRAIRLLLPFLAWIPVYWMVNRYLRHFDWPVKFLTTARDAILHPATGLWFLPTLFLCSLLLIPVRRLEKWRSWAGEVSLLLIFIAVNLIPFNDLGIMQVKYFFLFFAVGYLLSKHRARIEAAGRERIEFVLLGLSALFLLLFTILYYYGRIHPFTFPVSLAEFFKEPTVYVIRYLMAGLGIIFSITLIRVLIRNRPRAVFAWFGLVTMDIYVAHGLMLQLTFGSGAVKVIVSVITGTLLSLALSFLFLRQWWVSAMVFYGIKRPEKPAVET